MAKRSQMVRAGSRLIRWTFQSLLIVLGAVLVTLAVYHHPTGGPATVVNHRTTNKSHHVAPVSLPAMPPPPPPSPTCDLFSGHWVFDNLSYPLYKDRECRFMFDDLACEKYGRKDLSYQHWRWQPHGCDLPRFNAKALLERLRGKRLVFVGDSINRNQWVSMICLLESSIPQPFKYMKLNSSLYTFKATEYNVSIDFYWSPLLVESNCDDPSNHSFWDPIVRIKSIEKHARHWGDADILVFNSYLWWRTPKLKLLEGSFESPNKAYKEVKALRCYKMALKTLSNWLDINVNRTKMQLFYVSMSATHVQAEEWGMQRHQTCLNETNPISIQGFRGNHGSDPRMMRAVEAMVSKLQEKGLKMQMLNITQLSEYRKDGHPSIYRKQWRPLTKKQLSDPRNYADCTHWCLPGVPDVWNELLQSYILQN
ncbi:protein trichome birefringence-like 34 [Diospyros lotus]|uniref:protein trichome birefringence-like 34 n=1 Tax=Diospyros lotus TaxID=55363 RepID=UPI0022534AB9|nr:protein trichome birefringence-like 34 [Diospyros lotus]